MLLVAVQSGCDGPLELFSVLHVAALRPQLQLTNFDAVVDHAGLQLQLLAKLYPALGMDHFFCSRQVKHQDTLKAAYICLGFQAVTEYSDGQNLSFVKPHGLIWPQHILLQQTALSSFAAIITVN